MEEIKELPTDVSYHEDIIIRSSVIKEDDTDQWKKRRATPITEGLLGLSNLSSNASLCEDNHTRIFASMVPDEIIYNIGDYSKRKFDVCLLFGDLSGFTDLCEKYNKTGKGGPSRLTQILNNYIGAMVQEILSHGGDVLKFSGDAFIAMWKVTDHLSMKEAVHEALDSSLIIQKVYGRYQADVDVVIRVKLAVSAGPLMFSIIGDEISSHYFGFGTPVLDLKEAEALSLAGDIIVTRSTWQHVNPNEYLAEECRDGLNIKVFGVGPNWRNVQRKDTFNVVTSKKTASLGHTLSHFSLNDGTSSASGESDDEMYSSHAVHMYESSDQYALRPAVNMAVRRKMQQALKRFILAPVERGITSDEPIEYLTEIRQVTILFINCKVSYTLEASQCIDIAHKVFVTITRIVTEQSGCVNKVNMFDKDLMLLVIFGLRGLKHEMESQLALRCAKECSATLKKFENVNGVSIGVTTGKTYCGAFGHTLRREYTVISIIVNKAARIMVAYPNKVTCDRETFLHSKLEPKNFILQEYKPLKGIANPGPIYEFRELERTREVAESVSSRPLLGREKEIDLYLHLFREARHLAIKNDTEKTCYTMLVVHAESRQGKTRLLEEMVYSTHSSVPFIRFNLNKADLEEPYTALRLIFNQLLRINETSTVEEKKTKIVRRLKKYGIEDQYHLLNEVFMVDFPCLNPSPSPDSTHEMDNLKSIFQKLCFSVFVRYWAIAIDDSEYIDNSSWILIEELVKLNYAFIITTMGLRSYISQVALDVLKHPRVKVVQMKGIDKWYHVGLACQMLEVEAIPPELEKVIHLQSNGNPGWIESFLISLIQSGGLYIKDVDRKSAYDSGLIIAPLYMMVRLTPQEIGLWVQVMEEGTKNSDVTRWKMYVDSCRVSYPDLSGSTTLKEKFDLYADIKVCVLNRNFNIEDVDPELSMDVIILKTFDALTSYQQLLIKCSSVLGTIFPRAMLNYIMCTGTVRLTALAVKKLFEIHVLMCAKGDFVDGGLVFKERLKNPNEDFSIECSCRGLIIDGCDDLPKYASCGYMRFRSATFKDTTYNLLTDSQKKEFHFKAIRYLERETRRCRNCGNGYFNRLANVVLDKDLKGLRKAPRKYKTISAPISSESSSTTLVEEQEKTRSSFMASVARISDSTRRATGVGWGSGAVYEESVTESQMPVEWIGFRSVQKYKNDYTITRTFSDVDFSECSCFLILNTMFNQLVKHCAGAALWEKQVNAMIEYAYVCIEIQNVPQALKTLEDALHILEAPVKPPLEYDWMLDLKRAKVNALMAKGRIKLREHHEAHQHLKKALRLYGVRFPKTEMEKTLRRCLSNMTQYMALYAFPRVFQGLKLDNTEAEYYNDVSECMSLLCEYFMYKNQWLNAKLAAIWSMRYGIASSTDYCIVMTAFCNLLNVNTYFGDQTINIALEVSALKFCCRKRTFVEPRELRVVARMYSAIFFARLELFISFCEILVTGYGYLAFTTVIGMLVLFSQRRKTKTESITLQSFKGSGREVLPGLGRKGLLCGFNNFAIECKYALTKTLFCRF